MSDLLKSFLSKRRSIADAATPGPWRQSMADIWSGPVGKKEKLVADCDTNAWFDDVKAAQNAAFIADARNCIPLQLQIIEILDDALERIQHQSYSPIAISPNSEARLQTVQRLAVGALTRLRSLLKEHT